jgi:hypothetical protein
MLCLILLSVLPGCAAPAAPAERAPRPVEQARLEARSVVIPAPPDRVLPALFRAIAEGRRLDIALLGSLGTAERPPSAGEAVLSGAAERDEYCGGRSWELVPPATWAAFCKSEGPLRGIVIDGTPSVPTGYSEVLKRADDEVVLCYSYRVEQALRDAAAAGIPFEDITQAYQMNWPGHFPFMETVHAYVRPGQLLVLIYGEIGPQQPNVTRVSIYTR